MITLLITFLLCGTVITVSALAFTAKVVPALERPDVEHAKPEPPKRPRMRFRGSDNGITVTSSNGDVWWASMPSGPWHYQGTGMPSGAQVSTWDQWLAHKRTTVRDVWAERRVVEVPIPETKP